MHLQSSPKQEGLLHWESWPPQAYCPFLKEKDSPHFPHQAYLPCLGTNRRINQVVCDFNFHYEKINRQLMHHRRRCLNLAYVYLFAYMQAKPNRNQIGSKQHVWTLSTSIRMNQSPSLSIQEEHQKGVPLHLVSWNSKKNHDSRSA